MVPTPSPAPGRRLAAADRREQILREAMRCFASNGFRGTTTREIAAAVGITEAALYRYFPSKQSLYDAIVDARISALPLQEAAKIFRGRKRLASSRRPGSTCVRSKSCRMTAPRSRPDCVRLAPRAFRWL